MKKIIGAMAALFALGSVAQAGVLDEVVGAASLKTDVPTCISGEAWCFQAGVDFTSMELYGFDVGESTTGNLGVAWKWGHNQLGVSYATDFDDIGTSYVIGLRYRRGFEAVSMPSLK